MNLVYTLVDTSEHVPENRYYRSKSMKTTSIRDFRSRIAELLDSDEPVLVTRHGKNAAVLYPLHDPRKIPLEIRRRLFRDLTAEIGKQLNAKGVKSEDIERDFATHKKRRRG
jgi:prevent-host-death family protein